VLVINSGTEMAKEMTMQITLAMPGCSIMYAPSIELAKWILGRRKIDLVVSSPILPDGGVQRLRSTLEQLDVPPDIVVVGSLSVRNAEMIDGRVYEFATWRRIGTKPEDPRQQLLLPPNRPESPARVPRLQSVPKQTLAEKVAEPIQTLGADLRNDLNNPLQEIVAMVFVARATGDATPQTVQALDAIDRAAKNMASVVKGLEGKIRDAVDVEL
jgi:hypothetical protein